MVSILLVCSIEWRWCVLLLVHPVRWCDLCLAHPGAVLATTAVMSCYCLVAMCCGVWVVCVSVLFVWWGILCLLPPRRGGGWGYRWVVGGITRWGGMALKGGAVMVTLPSVCWCPPSVCMVVSLNGGSGVCCGVPVFVLSPFSSWCSPSCVVLSPLCCLASPCVVCCVLWVGKCGGVCL